VANGKTKYILKFISSKYKQRQ